MTASSVLMAAGANQQLVASKLEEPPEPPKSEPPAAGNEASDQKDESGEAPKSEDGTLSIEHDESDQPARPSAELPEPQAPDREADSTEPDKQDEHAESEPPVGEHLTGGTPRLAEPPQLSGTLSANTEPEGLDPVTDPLSLPSAEPPVLNRPPAAPAVSLPPTPPASEPTPPPARAVAPAEEPPAPSSSAAPALPEAPSAPMMPPNQPLPGQSISPTGAPSEGPQTLTEIEQSVHSPHIDTARDQVNQALNTGPDTSTPQPIAALNAQPLGEDLHPPAQPPLPTVTPTNEPVLPIGPTPAESSDTSPAPPGVPPPFPVQFGAGNAANTPPNQANPPL
jgi:hypothetical protein